MARPILVLWLTFFIWVALLPLNSQDVFAQLSNTSANDFNSSAPESKQINVAEKISLNDSMIDSGTDHRQNSITTSSQGPNPPIRIEISQNPIFLILQFVISGSVAGLALFGANIGLDRHRRPKLCVDTSEIPVVPIDLVAFETTDPAIPKRYRRFVLRYYVSRIIVENLGRNAADNCKGVLEIKKTKLKVCWHLPSERNKITINSCSLEYLDLCAVFLDDRDQIVLHFISEMGALRKYIDSLSIETQQRLSIVSDSVNVILSSYRTGEDIPYIIAPVEDGWLHPPARNRIINPGDARVIVTAKNGPPVWKQITILDKPDKDNRIVRFKT
ncbi:exported protein of unknown function [Nitrososphaera viennensis EN76]|uniref:Uncharacterized protein n=1 Tax=Nitrososphaera viennensis EN76 TaxID=926571 RepID=A0A060HUR1_9ARCH|nr:exported protein of unknown function [Nitrososphaera viennensis EN76]